MSRGSAQVDSNNGADLVVHDRGRLNAILSVVCLSLFVVMSGVTMINIGLPKIASDLGATATQMTWIMSIYPLVLAGLLLFSGAIGDRYGRRYLLMIGLAIFGFAALGSLFVSDPTMMIALRAVMGLGAAAIMPSTLSIITTSFPVERRGKAIGIWAAVLGAAGVIGMLVSGTLLEFFSWHSLFLFTLVLAVAAFVATYFIVPNSKVEHAPRLDFVGAILSLVAVVGLVFGIIEGSKAGWSSPEILLAIPIGLISGVAFILWESRQENPLLDPRIFKLRGLSAGVLSNTVQTVGVIGFYFILTQYVQYVLGYSPLIAALSMLPIALFVIPVSIVSSKFVQRYGYNKIGGLGLLILASGFVVFSFVTVDMNPWIFFSGISLIGLGLGFSQAPATAAISGSLPPSKQGIASAINDTTKAVGEVTGTAVAGAVLVAVYTNGVASFTSGLQPQAAEAVNNGIPTASQAAQQIGGAAGEQIRAAADQAFVSGVTGVMIVAAVLVALGALYVFFRGPHKISEQPIDNGEEPAELEEGADADRVERVPTGASISNTDGEAPGGERDLIPTPRT